MGEEHLGLRRPRCGRRARQRQAARPDGHRLRVLLLIGGATATGVPISDWFFIIGAFGSLFMVVGKRHAERVNMGEDAAAVRSTLGEYSESYLAYLRAVTSGSLLIAYCLLAFEK